ncbi:hypothetical protein SJAG_04528 [Schizosaccharomyces japonicus yFS275]|uniref:GRIP domain-containing protein n=1 Tax=Schizosaccharomyces japonicus (strain yFS275 / FY16936) TaxID=402676 RepID=B6K724_SCHJY|nr:hypothetical protein SJAG_04528 [Schizosaccharomyces japonicus yFS275]EEB09328.1 hypothetical protein SJAG_04528 [Schizosaccharomyces japonicus yFS275]
MAKSLEEKTENLSLEDPCLPEMNPVEKETAASVASELVEKKEVEREAEQETETKNVPETVETTEADAEQKTKAESSTETVAPDETSSPSEAERELKSCQLQLKNVQSEKSKLESQYRGLLNKISGIKRTLGERLKHDAKEITEQREKIKSLQKANTELKEELIIANEESTKLTDDVQSLRSEVESLRRDKQSWMNEREQLNNQALQWERKAKDTFDALEQVQIKYGETDRQLEAQLQVNESLDNEVCRFQTAAEKLKQQLASAKEQYTKETQEIRQTWQTVVDDLSEKLQSACTENDSMKTKITNMEERLSRTSELEQSVKEKSLIIGKLQHEAVILNEHLTKALRLLKSDENAEKVDKQLISNLLVSFLSLPRADTKRFEILQLIASVLEWNDEQREQVGVQRPGSSADMWSVRRNSSSNSLLFRS